MRRHPHVLGSRTAHTLDEVEEIWAEAKTRKECGEMVKPYYAGLPVGAAQMTSHAIGADVTSLAFSPDGERLAVATTDGQVRVFRVHSNGDFSGSARYLGHRQAVNTVAWSPDGTCIASAGNDTAVHVWDAIRGEVRYIYRGHAALVYALAFSPDGAWIASAGLASELLVWIPKLGCIA